MAEYLIDYTIRRIDEDDEATEIGFGGTSQCGSIKEAAYEVESQLANEQWAHTAEDGGPDAS